MRARRALAEAARLAEEDCWTLAGNQIEAAERHLAALRQAVVDGYDADDNGHAPGYAGFAEFYGWAERPTGRSAPS